MTSYSFRKQKALNPLAARDQSCQKYREGQTLPSEFYDLINFEAPEVLFQNDLDITVVI
jgi:hypothetical protein